MTAAKNQITDMDRIRRQLRKMAFGKSNDCVKLALNDYQDLASLDLSLLTEMKKTDKGVEIKLLDRTKIMAQLLEISAQSGESDAAQALLKALERDDEADE